ncbi:AI-2E family transporter [Candidatus Parcubacteria bacterium]|nr:AI-2E family transporter [Candidatus Parcubacteria bacterium]
MDRQRVIVSISTSTILKIFALVALGFLLFVLRDVVLILLTAVVFASAIEPGTLWFIRRGVPRIIGVTLIYLLSAILIAGLFYFLLPPFLSDLGGFIKALPQYITALNLKAPVAVQGLSTSTSFGQTVENIITTLSNASGSILATLTTVFGGATSFVLIIVLSFYLAVQDHGIEDFLKLVAPLKHEHYVIDLWRRTQRKIGRWMQGQLLLAIIVGLLVFVGLALLGVHHAFSLALIALVFEIIPIFGPILSAVPGIATAFIQGGFTFALIVGLMYLVVQQIESHVIYPIVVKKVVNVHPLVVIIAFLVGAKLGGFLGILLSVPLATALTEFMNDVARDRVAARARMNDNG